MTRWRMNNCDATESREQSGNKQPLRSRGTEKQCAPDNRGGEGKGRGGGSDMVSALVYGGLR